MQRTRSTGMTSFMIIWTGQIVSLLGTGMTNFGIPIWVFGRTERATDLTTMGGLYVAALLIVSPFAGVLIDRSNRKLMMMLSDLGSGLVTLGVFVLFSLGRLQIWHLYVSAVVQGAFQSFQWPAFSAAISVMLPKEQYVRASSMMGAAETGAQIFSPMLAGSLLGFLGQQNGLQTILLIDIVTFVAAIGTLLFIHVPQPAPTSAQQEATKGGFAQELLFGFGYIFKRPSLLGLQTVFMLGNLLVSVSYALMAPMILSRTNSNELIFASVQSIGAAGGLIGGLVIGAWGGFKRRVHGVLLGWMLSGLLGTVIMGLGRAEPAWAGLPVWALAAFLGTALIPLVNGSNQAIWQAKVSPDIQGKVFSARRLIAWVVTPLSNFVAGPLADQVLEPAMRAGGGFTGTFGWLVGTGPGAGMSLTFIFTGLLAAAIGLGGYLVPAVRNAEDILPDHEVQVALEGDVAESTA